MARKKRSDSIAKQVEMAMAEEPKVPDCAFISDEMMPYWRSIVTAREYRSWTEIDLIHAANLARCLWEIEQLYRENGDKKEIETLVRRSVAMSRFLQVHAQATVGDADEQAKRNQKQREMKSDLANFSDGLIAPPAIN